MLFACHCKYFICGSDDKMKRHLKRIEDTFELTAAAVATTTIPSVLIGLTQLYAVDAEFAYGALELLRGPLHGELGSLFSFNVDCTIPAPVLTCHIRTLRSAKKITAAKKIYTFWKLNKNEKSAKYVNKIHSSYSYSLATTRCCLPTISIFFCTLKVCMKNMTANVRRKVKDIN